MTAFFFFLLQFSMRKLNFWPYHKNCYKELYHPRCDICKQYVSVIIRTTLVVILFIYDIKYLFEICELVFLQSKLRWIPLLLHVKHVLYNQMVLSFKLENKFLKEIYNVFSPLPSFVNQTSIRPKNYPGLASSVFVLNFIIIHVLL